MQPCPENHTSFFEKLQQTEGLDLLDNRGKRDNLAVLLVGVTIALLSNRDGSLSSIHRHLVNHREKLGAALKVEIKRPVSRSQLPLILAKVSLSVFEKMLFAHYGMKLNEAEKRWFAVDGKELAARRSNCAGGFALGARNLSASVLQWQSGKKDSEIETVRALIRENQLSNQKLSRDARQCQWKTLGLIARQSGKYVVGVKENQKQLFDQLCEPTTNSFVCLFELRKRRRQNRSPSVSVLRHRGFGKR